MRMTMMRTDHSSKPDESFSSIHVVLHTIVAMPSEILPKRVPADSFSFSVFFKSKSCETVESREAEMEMGVYCIDI